MKTIFIPISILIFGICFTYFTFNNHKFVPVESYKRVPVFVVNNIDNKYVFAYDGTSNLYITTECLDIYDIGNKIYIQELVVNGKGTQQYKC